MPHYALRCLSCVLVLLLLAGAAQPGFAQDRNRSKKIWALSVAALVAANLLDAGLSRGRFETNPLLQDPQGRFDFRKALWIKSGGSAAVVTVQFLLIRTSPHQDLSTPAAVANFAGAAAFTAFALRNSRIPPSPAPPAAPTPTP